MSMDPAKAKLTSKTPINQLDKALKVQPIKKRVMPQEKTTEAVAPKRVYVIGGGFDNPSHAVQVYDTL